LYEFSIWIKPILRLYCVRKIKSSFITKTGQLLSKEHRTNAAAERSNDLWCYQCDSMDDGDRCINLTDNIGNSSTFKHKCINDKRMCMVSCEIYLYLFHFYATRLNAKYDNIAFLSTLNKTKYQVLELICLQKKKNK